MNAYILVGGRSRRIGEAKAEVAFGGTTLLGRVVGAASGAFERVIAVQRAGGNAVSIETIYEDPHEDEAPIFGVAAAIRHAKEKCFVIAVDYPLLTAAGLAENIETILWAANSSQPPAGDAADDREEGEI